MREMPHKVIILQRHKRPMLSRILLDDAAHCYWLRAPEIDRVRETVDVLRKFLGGGNGTGYPLRQFFGVGIVPLSFRTWTARVIGFSAVAREGRSPIQ